MTCVQHSPDATAPVLPMISVALIEDNRLVREGMTSLLNETGEVRVVVSSSSPDTALIARAAPQVVLLDVGLGDHDSVRVVEDVRNASPESRVVVLDLLPLQDDLVHLVNAGVSGFVLKYATFDELVHTIHAVARGEHVLPRAMTSTLFSQIASDALRKGRQLVLEDVRMTSREREVIDLIGRGHSNKEIAAALGIATHTVKSHVRNVMEKLELHTRLQIAAYAHGVAEE